MRLADLERFDGRATRWFLRLFGLALVVEVVTQIDAGVWRVHAGELYPWRHIPLVPLYPTWALAIEWALTIASGAALALGRRLRIATRVAALATFAAVLQRYSNHGALLFLVALYLAIDPPDPSAPDFSDHPRHGLGLVRAQLAIVYVFSAINKLAHGFVRGAVLATLLGWPVALARAASWGVVVAELALPFVLVRAPRVGIVGVVLLHAAFVIWQPYLASFALAMIACAVLYLRPRASSGSE